MIHTCNLGQVGTNNTAVAQWILSPATSTQSGPVTCSMRFTQSSGYNYSLAPSGPSSTLVYPGSQTYDGVHYSFYRSLAPSPYARAAVVCHELMQSSTARSPFRLTTVDLLRL